jgi:hypothetical protein
MRLQFQTNSKIQGHAGLRTSIRNPFSADFLNRLLLSVGLGIFVPGSGALAYGMGDIPSWAPIRATLANQSFFEQIAVVAFGLTLALMLEMRFAGVMGRREERERRMVFRWFVIGGLLTTACAVAGACTAPANLDRTPTRTLAALFGASIYGSFIVGGLILFLSVVPREGFAKLAAREDRRLAKQGAALRKRTLSSTHYLRLGIRATSGAVILVAADTVEWYLALPSLLLAGVWLTHAWHSRHREVRADEHVPLHPVTLIAVILGGISLVFLGHHLFPSLEPAKTKTATAIYGIISGVLASGYVMFAGDHRLERRSGLLPNLHTVGAQCAIVGLAGLGLGGALLGAEHSGGWFAFWITVVSTPAMLTQAYLVRSSSIRT